MGIKQKISRLHYHVLPHVHADGEQHHAHGLSVFALFLYLQIFVAATAGFYVIKLKAPQILGTITFSADQIISLTNQRRAENGLPVLTFNSFLANAASAKASNMFSENYWAHNSPSGKTPWSFITAAGYKYIYAGENLARDFNDASSVVTAWMNSPSHKSNLLDKNFKEIGVAVVSGNLTGTEGILVVQEFGSGAGGVQNSSALAQALPTPSPASVVKSSPSIAPKSFVSHSNASPSTLIVASPSPSPEPSISPLPNPAVAAGGVAITQGAGNTNPTSAAVLGGKQFSVSKAISFGLVGFVFLLFVVEIIFVAREEKLKLRSGVLAHLGILAFVLLVIWYAVSGAIL